MWLLDGAYFYELVAGVLPRPRRGGRERHEGEGSSATTWWVIGHSGWVAGAVFGPAYRWAAGPGAGRGYCAGGAGPTDRPRGAAPEHAEHAGCLAPFAGAWLAAGALA